MKAITSYCIQLLAIMLVCIVLCGCSRRVDKSSESGRSQEKPASQAKEVEDAISLLLKKPLAEQQKLQKALKTISAFESPVTIRESQVENIVTEKAPELMVKRFPICGIDISLLDGKIIGTGKIDPSLFSSTNINHGSERELNEELKLEFISKIETLTASNKDLNTQALQWRGKLQAVESKDFRRQVQKRIAAMQSRILTYDHSTDDIAPIASRLKKLEMRNSALELELKILNEVLHGPN